MNRLRVKMYLMILPLVVIVVIVSGFLTSLESQTAMTRAANRHMTYKAEQMRDFAYSEWNVIERLKLAGKEEYRIAAEQSLLSYAYSLLRTGTEQIFVFDADGLLISRIGLQVYSSGAADLPAGTKPVHLSAGWFSGQLFGQERVGVVFSFEPFGWTVAITELHAAFFADIRGILLTQALILLIAVLIVTIVTTIYVSQIAGPVERLAGTIDRIAQTGDLSHRALIEYNDEIGLLADRFNAMLGTIQTGQRELEAKSREAKDSRDMAVQREIETLYLLGRIADFRDEQTGNHLNRIGSLSALFARLIGQSAERQLLIKNSAPLHDIGKIAIPDAILLKPAKLTAAEFEIIKQHTVLGHDLLKNSQSAFLIEGAAIAITHHERWDGTGYPNGLSGDSIPLFGRIVSIVDVFDALISPRPYKTPWSKESALEYILSQRGKQFDPALVDCFSEHFLDFSDLT